MRIGRPPSPERAPLEIFLRRINRFSNIVLSRLKDRLRRLIVLDSDAPRPPFASSTNKHRSKRKFETTLPYSEAPPNRRKTRTASLSPIYRK